MGRITEFKSKLGDQHTLAKKRQSQDRRAWRKRGD
jgi:hypothetical protein